MPADGQVLYRKWRPHRFDEVAGQEHATHTLRQAIATGRFAHAYLLCGPRGTGKTSTARILAKALNCHDQQEGEPCGKCENCLAIDEGRMMDLIEIDAASNRGIDDIRDLRDRARFAPTHGRFKVYVIDEVHQLTDAAFNALLKTLEEPPPHTVMVLATTEAHRVPATILSRCQRFDFRRLPNDTVVDRLAEICGEEEIDTDEDVLSLIARAAYGSLRDAENILEQLAVSYGSEISMEQALELLGMSDTGSSLELATAALKGDAKTALEVINREASRGTDLTRLRKGAVDVLRAGLLIKAGVEDALGHPQEVVDAMTEACRGIGLSKLLQVLTEFGKADFRQDPSSPLPLELAVLNSVAEPAPAPSAAQHQGSQGAAPAPQAPAPPRPQQAPPSPPSQRQAAPSPPGGQSPQPQQAQAQPQSGQQGEDDYEQRAQRRLRAPSDERWAALVKSLSRTHGAKYNLGALLRDVGTVEVGDETLRLEFRNSSIKERMAQELGDPRGRGTVESAVEQAYGVKLKVAFLDEEPGGAAEPGDPPGGGGPRRSSPTDSHLVRAAMAMGARIIDEDDSDEEDAGGQDSDSGQG